MTSGPMAPSLTGKSQALSPTFRCADFALGFLASIAMFLAELNGWGDACWRPVRPEIRKPYAGQGQVRCNMAISIIAGLRGGPVMTRRNLTESLRPPQKRKTRPTIQAAVAQPAPVKKPTQ